ncbi:MAG: hypothetical protein LBT21_06865 [Oscillospiraceae bacterium]|jgi:hypothetical protein|nr:hypothetical protein [Oscillospiraceae bacterium]
MKRLLVALITMILLAACVSGDDYLNVLTFIRCWNSFETVREREELRIDADRLWHDTYGKNEEYAMFFGEDQFLLRLLREEKNEFVLMSSLTGLYDDGKFSKEKKAEFYTLVRLMMRAMCGFDSAECADILKRGCLDEPQAAHYYQYGFYAFISIEDDFGVTFRIENLRLVPREAPEMTLVLPTTQQPPEGTSVPVTP